MGSADQITGGSARGRFITEQRQFALRVAFHSQFGRVEDVRVAPLTERLVDLSGRID